MICDTVRLGGACHIRRETIALFEASPDLCEIEDPVRRRRIRIVRQGGHSTVVWHPGGSVAAFKDIPAGTDRHFLCVESGNIGASGVQIAAGAEHRLAVAYDVVAL